MMNTIINVSVSEQLEKLVSSIRTHEKAEKVAMHFSDLKKEIAIANRLAREVFTELPLTDRVMMGYFTSYSAKLVYNEKKALYRLTVSELDETKENKVYETLSIKEKTALETLTETVAPYALETENAENGYSVTSATKAFNACLTECGLDIVFTKKHVRTIIGKLALDGSRYENRKVTSKRLANLIFQEVYMLKAGKKAVFETKDNRAEKTILYLADIG